MRHFGVYWPWFENEQEPWPLRGWYVGGGSRLVDVRKGDYLWLFSSGTKIKKKWKKSDWEGSVGSLQDSLGYLLQVFVVESIAPEGFSRHLIYCQEMFQEQINPPFLIDDFVRPYGRDKSINIGTLRQAPFPLDDHGPTLLRKISREYPEYYRKVFGDHEVRP